MPSITVPTRHLLASAALLCIGSWGTAQAASLYVSSDATPNPSATFCDMAQRCDINDALRIAANNGADDEVILVAPSNFIGGRDIQYNPAASDFSRSLLIRVESGLGQFDGAGQALNFWIYGYQGDIEIRDIRIRSSHGGYNKIDYNYPLKVYNTSGDITLRDVTIQDNARFVSGYVNEGGAGAYLRNVLGTVTVLDSTFLNNQPGALRIETDYAVISGSTFFDNHPHANDSVSTQGAVKISATSVVVENNDFTENQCLAGSGAAALEVTLGTTISANAPSASSISGNRFVNNDGDHCAGGIRLDRATPVGVTFIAPIAVDGNLFIGNRTFNAAGAAVRAAVSKGARLMLRNNLMVDNQTIIHPPAGVSTSGPALFAELDDSATARLINNTIVENPVAESAVNGAAVHVRTLSDLGIVDLYNNILFDNPSNAGAGTDSDLFMDGNSDAQVTVRYNRLGNHNLYGGVFSSTVDVSDNLSVTPGFVNAAAGDYHLLQTSPLINAGHDPGLNLLPALDIDGQARVQGGTVDIGFDEYSGALLKQVTVLKFGGGDGPVSSLPSGMVCGVGCSTGTAFFEEGSTIALLAIADDDSDFVGWDGDCNSTNTPFTMLTVGSSSNTCFALFTAKPLGSAVFRDGFD